MLSEWLLSKTAQKIPSAAGCAYADALAGLWARGRRCAGAWQAHQQASKQFIIEQIPRVAKRKRVVVLGAGILADVPLAALHAAFDHVVLVDVAVLWPTRWQLRAYRRAEYCLHDVTTLSQQMPPAWVAGFSLPYPADWVISLNLLSQLPLLPLGYAQRSGYYGESVQENQFVTSVCQAHMVGLQRLPCAVSCLADLYQRTWQGEVLVAESDFSTVLPVSACLRRWRWPVAPLGEAGVGLFSEHQVGAWHWDHTTP